MKILNLEGLLHLSKICEDYSESLSIITYVTGNVDI